MPIKMLTAGLVLTGGTLMIYPVVSVPATTPVDMALFGPGLLAFGLGVVLLIFIPKRATKDQPVLRQQDSSR